MIGERERASGIIRKLRTQQTKTTNCNRQTDRRKVDQTIPSIPQWQVAAAM